MASRALVVAVAAFAGLALPAAPAHAQSPAGTPAGVGPGDKIALRVYLEPEITGEYRVDDTGEVVLPKLGQLRVAAMHPNELRDSIRSAYARYLRNPAVEVAVLRRIGVHGEVKEPTLYWVDLTMTVRDVVALAGGITEQGDPEKVEVLRAGQRIDFGDRGSVTLLDARLQSGDQVIVGRRGWLSLNAPYVISTGISLLSVLAGIYLSTSN